jgi:hypothetical protein
MQILVLGTVVIPDRSYSGGFSSADESQRTVSDLKGSGRSQSMHCIVRRPLPPGGSARIRNAPHSGHIGRCAWPMEQFCHGTNVRISCPARKYELSKLFNQVDRHRRRSRRPYLPSDSNLLRSENRQHTAFRRAIDALS